MNNALRITKADFESSSGKTPQYLAWHRTFKREFTKYLTALGCTDIKIGKPNHFDMSGFFNNKDGQMFYFRISDLRGFKDNMLVRTAKHDRDFTGGRNQYATLSDESSFERDFIRIIRQPNVCLAQA